MYGNRDLVVLIYIFLCPFCSAVDGFCNINANSAFGSNSDQSSVSSPPAVVNVVGGSSTSSEFSPAPEVKEEPPSGEQTQVEQDVA